MKIEKHEGTCPICGKDIPGDAFVIPVWDKSVVIDSYSVHVDCLDLKYFRSGVNYDRDLIYQMLGGKNAKK